MVAGADLRLDPGVSNGSGKHGAATFAADTRNPAAIPLWDVLLSNKDRLTVRPNVRLRISLRIHHQGCGLADTGLLALRLMLFGPTRILGG